MRVFLTGSASHLAKALLPTLCADARITAITGIDIRATAYTHGKFKSHRLDMRAPEIESLIKGHDALIHLAFVVLRGKMKLDEMRDTNVRGTQQIFTLAKAAGLTKRIHLSSAAVYGAGDALTESAPLAPVRGFAYAEQKAELEAWFDAHDPQAKRFRPHVILGPHAQALLHTITRQPFYLRLPDPQPQLQCVHEDDVVQALIAALFRPVAGAFNLACVDTLSLRDVICSHRSHAIGLSPWLAKRLLGIAWRLSGWGGEPGWIDAARHPLSLDTQRARDLLGWQPRYTAQDILATS